MITVLLTILKIIVIILLCVLGLILAVLTLVLFVPVRYRITACKKAEDEVPVRVSFQVTWLLHSLNAAFRYPEQAYLRVRLFCFTIFSTNREAKEKKSGKQEREKPEAGGKAAKQEDEPKEQAGTEYTKTQESTEYTREQTAEKEKSGEDAKEEEEPEQSRSAMLHSFLKKLLDILKNIQYTIEKICGKIKEVIKNIRYYLEIVQSDPFKRAFSSCGGEALSLLRSVFPYRIRGSLLIGTGDPAGTARIIGLQGILYPLIGDHIIITPDFEHTVMEGNLSVRGKITLFRAVKTALKIYFNKDLRKVIRLLKKEAA